MVSGTDDHGEPTLGVAHEALFRVWDTLNGWLRADRKALALRSQVEDAAAEWHDQGRPASLAWSDERVHDATRKIAESGVSLDDARRQDLVRAFLGPTDPNPIVKMLSLEASEDGSAGSGRFGDDWRLPLSHKARASAGVRLALLGDTRPGVGLRADGLPDIDWCRIEGGKVTIEVLAEPVDPYSAVKERIMRTVKPFWMARYPVTIDQFRAFCRECYVDGRWQLPRGFPVQPSTGYDPPKHRTSHGNHPADSLTWFDAMIFCQWLGARLETDVRLPTEFEWQIAASGSDLKRVYP